MVTMSTPMSIMYSQCLVLGCPSGRDWAPPVTMLRCSCLILGRGPSCPGHSAHPRGHRGQMTMTLLMTGPRASPMLMWCSHVLVLRGRGPTWHKGPRMRCGNPLLRANHKCHAPIITNSYRNPGTMSTMSQQAIAVRTEPQMCARVVSVWPWSRIKPTAAGRAKSQVSVVPRMYARVVSAWAGRLGRQSACQEKIHPFGV